jgi:hypothetical protein
MFTALRGDVKWRGVKDKANQFTIAQNDGIKRERGRVTFRPAYDALGLAPHGLSRVDLHMASTTSFTTALANSTLLLLTCTHDERYTHPDPR